MKESSRRRFLKSLTGSAAAVAIGSTAFGAEKPERYFEILKSRRGSSASDNINIALIGAGGMGTQDTITALTVPGIKLVAVCDLYDGPAEGCKNKMGRGYQYDQSVQGNFKPQGRGCGDCCHTRLLASANFY